MEKIKWGVLGTAGIASGCTIPGMLLSENSEAYAIAGRSEEKVNKFVEKFGFKKGYVGYEKLLQDPDVQAVYVPLPNDIHKKWVIEAVKAGKHVLCEKPLAMNASEVAEMFAAAEENNVFLMEAYAYLHSPYMLSLVEDVKSGIIGDVVFIDTAFLTQGYHEDFRLHKEFGGGALYDLGCYCTTMILSLIDSNIKDVKAVCEKTDLGVDKLTTAIMSFENGASASFNVGMILGENSNARFDRLYIRGTKGTIISDVPYNAEGMLSYRIEAEGKTIVRAVNTPQNYSIELSQLGKCILENEKPHITKEFSLKNARLLDEILKQIGY